MLVHGSNKEIDTFLTHESTCGFLAVFSGSARGYSQLVKYSVHAPFTCLARDC